MSRQQTHIYFCNLLGDRRWSRFTNETEALARKVYCQQLTTKRSSGRYGDTSPLRGCCARYCAIGKFVKVVKKRRMCRSCLKYCYH